MDYVVHCPKCDVHTHLGQEMACVTSFGYGSNDREGREAAGQFISHHTYHEGHGPLVVCTHDILNARVSKTSRSVEMRLVDQKWQEFPDDNIEEGKK